ncbi:EscN/YscN/HrcN family type III secretion system ATPase [Hahella sp. KA22]|uniref:type III secretion system ATPase SctN n=1 Tax=Hahella sp. KA22 TaxID=1628392 RepID=UPI000FDE4E69|nr:type III secretion system ATPase SctN [Hahella sp. KA22]AZZ92408.1 EscN/YscN/HrcN family type III secretion system ATPase [Hahella sp. KA22]
MDQTVFSDSAFSASRARLLRSLVEQADFAQVRGRVTQAVGTIVKASVNGVRIGEICELVDPESQRSILAEVIGFSRQEALLTPLSEMEGLSAHTEVIPTGRSHEIQISEGILGRVLDGLGAPIDDGEPLTSGVPYPIISASPNPLTRRRVETPMTTGVRAIDGMLTCGEGQRMGVFAAAGVGKSTLLSMITRHTDADIVVIGLIGERGREVRGFIERDLGAEGMQRAVVVAATSDRPAMERVKAGYVATAIAEYFRDQGKRVLLLMDSVTRFARALREIGLAAGDPPARRGFPPTVFATLPKLLERAGPGAKGAISALYTVLVEGDDMTEPVADEVRSILDGHIVLSRALAESGHFPAVDILASSSRLMNDIATQEQLQQARRLRQLLARYKEIELLVRIGEYQPGTDPLADAAIKAIEPINQFLRQHDGAPCSMADTLAQLQSLAQH